MQSVTDSIHFIVGEKPTTDGCFLVWVDTEDCSVSTNYTIYLSPDNRTRGEREPLAQRLKSDMNDIMQACGVRIPICFASPDKDTAAFAAMFYAGLCGIKLGSVWSKLVETTTIYKTEKDENISVPLFHMSNASFRLILTRFK